MVSPVVMMQVVSVIDSRTTTICLHAAGQIAEPWTPFQTLNGEFYSPPFHIHCRSIVQPWQPGYVSDVRGQANAELQRRPMKQRRIGPDGETGSKPPPQGGNPPVVPTGQNVLQEARDARVAAKRAELERLFDAQKPPVVDKFAEQRQRLRRELDELTERARSYPDGSAGQRTVQRMIDKKNAELAALPQPGSASQQSFLPISRQDWERLDRSVGSKSWALDSYIADDFDVVNQAARGIAGMDTPVMAFNAATDRGVGEHVAADLIRQMDADFTRKAVALDRGGVVYRGMGVDHLNDWLEGSYVVDGGYLSTSVSRSTAQEFADKSGGWVMEIRLPEGSRVLSGSDAESELILPRNGSFKVVSRDDATKQAVLEAL